MSDAAGSFRSEEALRLRRSGMTYRSIAASERLFVNGCGPVTPVRARQLVKIALKREEAARKSDLVGVLSPRIITCLDRERISSFEELAKKTAREILSIKNVGPCALREIVNALYDRGLALKLEAP